MSDDYGSRYTSAFPFPLTASSNRLYSGSLNGTIGPDDTSDEDWFKIPMLKGAKYEIKVTGGPEVYDLNDAKLHGINQMGHQQMITGISINAEVTATFLTAE